MLPFLPLGLLRAKLHAQMLQPGDRIMVCNLAENIDEGIVRFFGWQRLVSGGKSVPPPSMPHLPLQQNATSSSTNCLGDTCIR